MKYLFLIVSLAISILAAPSATQTIEQRDTYEWTPALAGYFDVVFQYIQTEKAGSSSDPPSCDLSKASMPVAPSPLPSPDGLTLVHVAVGRGIQVHPCEQSHADIC